MISAQKQSDANRALYASLPPVQLGVNRILHDRESSRIRGGNYPYLSRFYDPKAKKMRGFPETVRFNGGKSHVKLAPQWKEYLAQINSEKGLKYIERPDSGWRNKGDEDTFEQLGWGGAFVVVYKIDGGKAYIRAFDNSAHLSDYGTDYNQMVSVIDQSNNLSFPNENCYSFVIANHGEALWMDVRDLAFLRAR